MAEAVERLRTALDEYRRQPRAFALREAMEVAKGALPSAFDAENEKKNGPYEQAAYDLYQQCEEALQSAKTPSTGVKGKRSRSEGSASDALEETKCAQVSSLPLASIHFAVRPVRPEKKLKLAALEQEGPAMPVRTKGESLEGADAMDIDETPPTAPPPSGTAPV